MCLKYHEMYLIDLIAGELLHNATVQERVTLLEFQV